MLALRAILNGLLGIYRDNFQLPQPTVQIAKRARTAQLEYAIRESRLHFVGAIASACFCLWVFFDPARSNSSILWLACALPLVLINYLMQFYIFTYQKNKLTLAQWEWSLFFIYAGWGALWSMAPWLFLPGNENTYSLMIMLLMLIAICVTVIIPASVYPASYTILAIPMLFSAHLYLLTMDISRLSPRQALTVGLLIPFFAIFLTLYMLKLRKTVFANTVLSLENEQANLNKSQFLAAASHDIRQPLQASNFYWEALSTETAPSDSMTKLGECLGSLSDLLDNLLDVSRLDARAIPNNPKHLRINDILETAARSFMPIATEKNIQLTWPTSDLFVFADPILLERVLSNLISNAISYTEHGSVAITYKVNNKELMLSVTDTGIGIPEDEQDAIFDEFYQLNNSERDRRKGFGLGLVIVKRLCQLMGCSLTLQSNPGVGSCFSITLPLGDAILQEQASSHPDSIEQKLLIFVIDDEEIVRDSLWLMLNRWNMDCVTFETIENAIEYMESTTDCIPDCILSDYRLRDSKTGVDAITSISSLLARDIPAILLTGDTHPASIQEAQKSGYTVIHKPVKPAYLRAAISSALA